MSLQMTQCRSFLWVIFRCIFVPHLLYPSLCWWTFRLVPCLGYYIINSAAMDIGTGSWNTQCWMVPGLKTDTQGSPFLLMSMVEDKCPLGAGRGILRWSFWLLPLSHLPGPLVDSGSGSCCRPSLHTQNHCPSSGPSNRAVTLASLCPRLLQPTAKSYSSCRPVQQKLRQQVLPYSTMESTLSTQNKSPNLKVESGGLFVWIFRTSSMGDSILSDPERSALRG